MSPVLPLSADAILTALQAQGVAIHHLCIDSRRLQPGDVFLAYPGYTVDGRDFIRDVVARGAVAVLWDDAPAADGTPWLWPADVDVPRLAVPGLMARVGELADAVYGHPSQDMWIIGVTGTNGKTSVTQWLARAFGELGRPCGIVGTLGCGFPGKLETSANTTPDALTLHRFFRRLHDERGRVVAMEVSSIGLDQGRVNGVHFDVAVFTNLTHDHLDYHGDMQDYAAAKARLFAMPGLKTAVINFDDAFGVRLAREIAARQDGLVPAVVGYTLYPDNAEVAPATRVIVVHSLTMTAAGMRMVVGCGDEMAELQAELVGQFNAANLLAVIGTLVSSGVLLKEAAKLASRLRPPAGRMQIIGGVAEPLVVVDYAHTPDALEKVLLALRPTVKARGGKLALVFGCGGDRDAAKRPLMAAVACRLADEVTLTSDNPRSEDPLAIIAQVAAGASGAYVCKPDRARAIARVIEQSGPDDVILLAGKGHETYQDVQGVRHPFSDVQEARQGLARWAELNP